MSVSHGSEAAVVINGHELSEYFNSATSANQRDAAEKTGFQSSAKTYIPGLKESAMSLEGLYDGDDSNNRESVDLVLWNVFGSRNNNLLTYFTHGADFGGVGWCLESCASSYEITTDVGDVAQTSAEFSSGDNGRAGRGICLADLKEYTAADTGSSYDSGITGGTPRGGELWAYVIDTGTSVTITFQDSADGSTWADLGSATLGPNGSEVVSVTGTIREFLRVKWDAAATFTALVSRK